MFHSTWKERSVGSKFTFSITFLVEVEVVKDENVIACVDETELFHQLGLLEGVAGID